MKDYAESKGSPGGEIKRLTQWAARFFPSGRVDSTRARNVRVSTMSYGDPDKLIQLAQEGNREAEAALCYIAAIEIGLGKVLPQKLALYVGEILFNRRPSGRGKQRAERNMVRDMLILAGVRELEARGYTPTRSRNRHNKPPADSGCAVMSEVLRRIGMGIDEGTVEDIYDNQKNWWASFQ